MQILDGDEKKKEGIAGTDVLVCTNCLERPAEIFQVNGEFCLECWQIITHTNA